MTRRPTPRLVEASRRRHNWTKGEMFHSLDQFWRLPTIARSPDGFTVNSSEVVTEQFVERLRRTLAEAGDDRGKQFAALGVALLTANYRLDGDDLVRVINDADPAELYPAILTTAGPALELGLKALQLAPGGTAR